MVRAVRFHPFTIDLRSLALFRIGLGLCVLYDLWDRAGAFALHYTSAGIFRIHPPFGEFPLLSLHQFSGSQLYQSFLFILSAGFALSLTVGFFSRASMVASWVLSLSLQRHAPMLTFGADQILRLMLLYGSFLPVGAHFSVDRKLLKGQPAESCEGVAAAMILAQVAALYLMAAFDKFADPQWCGGDGVKIAIEAFPTDLGRWLLSFRALMRPLGYAVLLLQAAAPLAMLFGRAYVRAFAALLLICFQLSLKFVFGLGLFPYVSIVSLILFLPAELWRSRTSSAPEFRWKSWAAAAFAGIVIPWLAEPLSSVMLHANPLNLTLATLGLDQEWGMFAPLPERVYWFGLRGNTPGAGFDVPSGEAFRGWQRPETIVARTQVRWAQYIKHLARDPDSLKRLALAACRAPAAPASGLAHYESVDVALASEPVHAPNVRVETESAIVAHVECR